MIFPATLSNKIPQGRQAPGLRLAMALGADAPQRGRDVAAGGGEEGPMGQQPTPHIPRRWLFQWIGFQQNLEKMGVWQIETYIWNHDYWFSIFFNGTPNGLFGTMVLYRGIWGKTVSFPFNRSDEFCEFSWLFIL